MRELVSKMMLYRKEEEELEEDVKIDNTFNPTRQYFYQTLFYRALNPHAADVPPLDPLIHSYLTPEHRTHAAAASTAKLVKKEFKLVRKFNLEEKKNKAKAVMWKDIIGELAHTTPPNDPQETADTEYVKPVLKFSVEDEEEEARFNPSNPLQSFRRMVSFSKRDLVGEALKFMNNYILQRLAYSITNESYKHIAECAVEMRQACLSQQEETYWDDWFTDLALRNAKFYEYLRHEGVGLLRGSNLEIFRPLVLHQEIVEEIVDLD